MGEYYETIACACPLRVGGRPSQGMADLIFCGIKLLTKQTTLHLQLGIAHT